MRMARSVFIIAFACVLFIQPVPNEAARILGFFPTPSKSHLLIHCAIADTLANAGHDVTVIASFPNVYKKAKYKYIEIDVPGLNAAFTNEMINKPKPFYQKFPDLLAQTSKISNDSMSHPTVQKFLREHKENSFDLLILGYFMNDFYLGLTAHFKCPVVVSFMLQTMYITNMMIGNPEEISYVPKILFGKKQPMKFMDRVFNLLANLIESIFAQAILDKYNYELYQHHFPSDRYPSLDVVRKNISLILSNHHFSQGPIRPNVPALIEIGGIQIKEKPDPLPADIAKILDNAKNGAIYFSLGSNVQGADLSEEKVQAIFNVLSKLPQKVLWKWDKADVPGKSANIVFKGWLPQDDILAHPNVKLFITHGGLGSVVESQYHGVPMVGMPLFGDQPSNVANIKSNGFGIAIDYLTLTEDSFQSAILEVLNNPKYATAVKQFSTLYRDRPLTPRQMVTYWVDYVLRHKGAKHMQSPAVYMNQWQLLSLDVIAFLLFVIGSVIGTLVALCRCLCCRKKKLKTTKEIIPKHKKNR